MAAMGSPSRQNVAFPAPDDDMRVAGIRSASIEYLTGSSMQSVEGSLNWDTFCSQFKMALKQDFDNVMLSQGF